MNIGYVVQQFYPTAYGAGTHAYELVRELSKYGHEIHVITKGLPNQKLYEIFQEIHIHRIFNSIPVPYYFPFNSVLLWVLGKKIIQNLNLDIIVGHGFESSLYFGIKKTIPFVYKAAGTIGLQRFRKYITWRDLIGKIYFPILGRLERTAVRYANLTIAISDTIKHELVTTYKISKKRIYRIYNGVNTQRFHPFYDYSMIKRELKLKDQKIIIFVGRLSSIKGPHLLLQAIPAIIKKVPKSRFLFLGDGPLQPYLQYLIRKLRVSRYVKLLGFIPNSEIPKYFTMADLCVIPSVYEPFGLVALESLASETPILSSAQGGLAEIQNYLNGFPTIKSLSPSTIAAQINMLFSSPETLEVLGKRGRKIVRQKFTWKRCAEKTNKILKIIKKKGN